MILQGLGYNLYDKIIGWSVVIVLCITCATILYNRGIRYGKENPLSFKVYRGYALFLIGFAGTRLLFSFSDFEKQTNGETLLYTQFVLAAFTIGIFGSLSFLYVLEKYLLQLKRTFLSPILFIIGCIAVAFIWLAGLFENIIWLFRYIMYGFSAIGGFFLILLFWRLIANSTGDLRTKAINNLIAVLMILIGGFMDSQLFITIFRDIIWFPAVFPIIGLILFIRAQKID